MAEHESKAKGVEENTAEASVDNAFHQDVDGFARTAKASFEHGETYLHAEYKEGGKQGPNRV